MSRIHILRGPENYKHIDSEGWDFPLSEIDYLEEEHPGETFVLREGRLWEVCPGDSTWKPEENKEGGEE